MIKCIFELNDKLFFNFYGIRKSLQSVQIAQYAHNFSTIKLNSAQFILLVIIEYIFQKTYEDCFPKYS